MPFVIAFNDLASRIRASILPTLLDISSHQARHPRLRPVHLPSTAKSPFHLPPSYCRDAPPQPLLFGQWCVTSGRAVAHDGLHQPCSAAAAARWPRPVRRRARAGAVTAASHAAAPGSGTAAGGGGAAAAAGGGGAAAAAVAWRCCLVLLAAGCCWLAGQLLLLLAGCCYCCCYRGGGSRISSAAGWLLVVLLSSSSPPPLLLLLLVMDGRRHACGTRDEALCAPPCVRSRQACR